jgi:hypothetical protein
MECSHKDFAILLIDSNNIVGDLVKSSIKSNWNHMAFILVGKYYEKEKRFDIQGNIEYVVEVNWYKDHKGIKITPYKRFIFNYNAREFLIREIVPHNFTLKQKMKVIKELNVLLDRDMKYEESIRDLELSLHGPKDKKFEDKSSMFCSEFVAHFLKILGLLPDSISSNSYLPIAFTDDKEYVKNFNKIIRNKNLLKEKEKKIFLTDTNILNCKYKLVKGDRFKIKKF